MLPGILPGAGVTIQLTGVPGVHFTGINIMGIITIGIIIISAITDVGNIIAIHHGILIITGRVIE